MVIASLFSLVFFNYTVQVYMKLFGVLGSRKQNINQNLVKINFFYLKLKLQY